MHDYFEIDNVGRWNCRQHAMNFDETLRIWPCCGKISHSNPGCVRADHRPYEKPLDMTQTINDVPDPIVTLLGSRRGYGGNGSYIRFDIEMRNQILANPAHRDEPIAQKAVFPETATEDRNARVAFPALRCFQIPPDGTRIEQELLLWDGGENFLEIKVVIPEQLDLFIFEKTERSICLKVAEARTLPVETRNGVRGVQLKKSFTSEARIWTPLSEVTFL